MENYERVSNWESEHENAYPQVEMTIYRINNPHWVAAIRQGDEARRDAFEAWFETQVLRDHSCIVNVKLRNRKDCVLVSIIEA